MYDISRQPDSLCIAHNKHVHTRFQRWLAIKYEHRYSDHCQPDILDVPPNGLLMVTLSETRV